MYWVYQSSLQHANGNVFSRICLSVSNALTFESLDLESSFWYAVTSSESSGQARLSMSSGQHQGNVLVDWTEVQLLLSYTQFELLYTVLSETADMVAYLVAVEHNCAFQNLRRRRRHRRHYLHSQHLMSGRVARLCITQFSSSWTEGDNTNTLSLLSTQTASHVLEYTIWYCVHVTSSRLSLISK